MRSLLLSALLFTSAPLLLLPATATHGKAAHALRRHARLPTITCPDGQYFNKSGCEPCLENHMCAFSQIYPCPTGTSSFTGSSECHPATRGAYDAPSAFGSPLSGHGPSILSHPGLLSEEEQEGEMEDGDYEEEGADGWTSPQGRPGKKDACFWLGEMRCPSPDGKGKLCVDPMVNLESCGGCSIPDEFGYVAGVDCTALEGALDVSCIKGNCLISSCKAGYGVVQTSKGMQCVKDYDRLLQAGQQRAGLVVQAPARR